MEKRCFKCGEIKPLYEFYKHKQMKDGHLNKCKECTKSDSGKRFKEKMKDEEFAESERARQRDKYRRLGYKEKQKEWDVDKPWTQTSEYKNLHRDLKNKGLIPKGCTAHHWNYSKLRSVFVISKKLHRLIHATLEFDEESLCFKYYGMILDTPDLHFDAIEEIKKINGIDEKYIYVSF